MRAVFAIPGAVRVAVAVLACVAAAESSARADDARPGARRPAEPSPAPRPGAEAALPRVTWDESWPRVRAWEYVASGLSYAGVAALELTGRPTEANWRGDFLLDFTIRDAVGTRDEGAVSAWELAGDIPFYVSMAYPLLDALVVAGLGWGDWDVAWQMIAMGLEAYAVALPLVFVTQYVVHRERPYSRFCDSASPHVDCGTSQETQSFPSGHVTLVSTAAGLTCAHHTRIPLYGGGGGDLAACVTALGAATLTAVARMAIDSHYLTDVVVGMGIGALAGYAVPVLLHYGMRTDAAAPRRDAGAGRGAALHLAVIPTFGDRSGGVTAIGVIP